MPSIPSETAMQISTLILKVRLHVERRKRTPFKNNKYYSKYFVAGDEDQTDANLQRKIVDGGIDGFPPTFTEKPKIVPNESGTLVTMRFKVRSKPKAEMQWYKGNQKIQEGTKFRTKYVELGNDEYEVVLEISVIYLFMGWLKFAWVFLYDHILIHFQKPTADDGGDYKCIVRNDLGQLQVRKQFDNVTFPISKVSIWHWLNEYFRQNSTWT